jgi:hypothetical protein
VAEVHIRGERHKLRWESCRQSGFRHGCGGTALLLAVAFTSLSSKGQTPLKDLKGYVENHPAKALLGTPKDPPGQPGANALQRAYNSFRFVCAVARDLGPEYGVQKKDSGDFLPRVNGQGYWGDGLRTRTSGVDIVNDREGEGASPTWSNPKDDATAESFAPPPSDAAIVAAMGGNVVDLPDDGHDDGGDDDPVVVPVDLAPVLAAIESLRKRIEEQHLETLEDIAEMVAAFADAIKQAEARLAAKASQEYEGTMFGQKFTIKPKK